MRDRLLILALALAACGAPPPADRPVLELRGPAWVADASAGWDPQADALVVRATGRAALAGDRRAAERAAESAARDTIRAFLEVAVERLVAAFVERNVDLLSPADQQAVAGEPQARQDLAATALAGVRLKGQWSDDEAFYAWLELDAGEHVLPRVEETLSGRLADLARELTPGDRRALRDELTAVVAERPGR